MVNSSKYISNLRTWNW